MSKNTLGPHGIDLSAPGGIDALLAFHRQTFGDAVMEADPADAAAAAAKAAADAAAAAATSEPTNGFPEKTPVADMTPEQQVAYWKHQARKHEDRNRGTADYDAIKAERDRLKAETQTDAEKAIEEARREATEAGRKAAVAESLPRIVQAEFRAAAAGRIPADRLATVLEPLDLTKFLTADGSEVDTDKVTQFVDGIAPAGSTTWPDMGQGQHGSGSGKATVSSAKADYLESRKSKTTR